MIFALVWSKVWRVLCQSSWHESVWCQQTWEHNNNNRTRYRQGLQGWRQIILRIRTGFLFFQWRHFSGSRRLRHRHRSRLGRSHRRSAFRRSHGWSRLVSRHCRRHNRRGGGCLRSSLSLKIRAPRERTKTLKKKKMTNTKLTAISTLLTATETGPSKYKPQSQREKKTPKTRRNHTNGLAALARQFRACRRLRRANHLRARKREGKKSLFFLGQKRRKRRMDGRNMIDRGKTRVFTPQNRWAKGPSHSTLEGSLATSGCFFTDAVEGLLLLLFVALESSSSSLELLKISTRCMSPSCQFCISFCNSTSIFSRLSNEMKHQHPTFHFSTSKKTQPQMPQ